MKSKRKQKRLLQTDCHIGIVGSGLGGLAAALAILQCDTSSAGKKQRAKKAVIDGSSNNDSNGQPLDRKAPSSSVNAFQGRITIYERDKHVSDRKEGYGMTITYNPSGPLAQLDILESIARKDCPSRCHYLFNEKGEVMGYYGNAFHGVADSETDCESTLRGAGQRGNLRIPRAELRSILMDKIKEVDAINDSPRFKMAWGKRLVSYVDRPAVEKLNQIHAAGRTKTVVDSENIQSHRPVILHFEDGTTDEVDLLIGADGVNSVVAKQYLSTAIPSSSKKPSMDDVSPRYLGIFITVGISEHLHPLIDEQGYYTLDGEHRLFIMPFAGNRLDDQQRRTMWQLSYPVAGRDEAMRLSKLHPVELQKEILYRCADWHAPFPDMVKRTPLDTIWGTGLHDRDPSCFIKYRQSLEVHGRLPSHVVLIGDAAHAMSPFKGQGANQAMTDGPLLAKWLSQAKLDSAIRGYMTEMARRSEVKVRASREAACNLHTIDCWQWMASQDEVNSAIFHGIDPENVQSLLNTLKARSIGASTGITLDQSIRAVIKEMNISVGTRKTNISTAKKGEIPNEELHRFQEEALEYATHGHLKLMRELSRKSFFAIPKAHDSHHRNCLHLAAARGHLDVCHWLVSEANFDPKVRDINNKSAFDLAKEHGHEQLANLIQSWLKRELSPEREQTSPLNEAIEQSADQDLYRQAEQQLRPIRSMTQLHSLLQSNHSTTNQSNKIMQVLGCTVDNAFEDEHRKQEEELAREHGAVILRNFVPREMDQLALGALALRPLKLDLPDETNLPYLRGDAKLIRKQVEEIKARISIPTHSPVIAQTNFGPQLASTIGSKKRKIESVPLSKLRYLNLGQWNYNWGDRRYDKIPGANPFPESFTSLAKRAYEVAEQKIRKDNKTTSSHSKFDMAICNFYHLQRPSDRLGGHKDDVESDLTSPLITFSLGAPGIFLLGGESRSFRPTAILLRAGDCMVMSGKSRRYFHGVPTILEYEDNSKAIQPTTMDTESLFPGLGDALTENSVPMQNGSKDIIPTRNELLFMKAFLTSTRMNISIRQI